MSANTQAISSTLSKNVSPIISITTPIPNLNSFQTTAVQANNVSTQSLNVSSTATTNGITDNETIDCHNLVISDTAVFNGTVSSNSNCIATSAFVNTQINNLLGSSVPTLLSTIKEIDSAINNDPNFSTTMTTQLATKAGLSSSNTFSGTNVFTSQLAINDLIENISSATVSSNSLSISYTSNNAIIYTSPSSSSNISLTLTNIPTSYSNANINLTFIINTSSYKQYINSISINGSSYTMKASGGLSNISLNTSASIVIQNINIIFLSGSISQVLTAINSWF